MIPIRPRPTFHGFAECGGKAPIEIEPRIVLTALRRRGPPIEPPETWLLAIGWMRHGKVSLHDSPRESARPRDRNLFENDNAKDGLPIRRGSLTRRPSA